jgi:hypothetical protein
LMPLLWFDATLHCYESWFVEHLQASFFSSFLILSSSFLLHGRWGGRTIDR